MPLGAISNLSHRGSHNVDQVKRELSLGAHPVSQYWRAVLIHPLIIVRGPGGVFILTTGAVLYLGLSHRPSLRRRAPFIFQI